MADQFVAEIRIFAGNFAPNGWATCDGQLLPISQNTALFSLIGTFYGGNGTSNFALPNFQGSFPMHQGNGAGLTPRSVGETGGSQFVTLLPNEMPIHTHGPQGALAPGAPRLANPANAIWAPSTARPYASGPPNVAMHPLALSVAGGSQPHNNMPPFQTLTFIIALQGIFPPRS
jgi:microcystin-dependent protein